MLEADIQHLRRREPSYLVRGVVLLGDLFLFAAVLQAVTATAHTVTANSIRTRAFIPFISNPMNTHDNIFCHNAAQRGTTRHVTLQSHELLDHLPGVAHESPDHPA